MSIELQTTQVLMRYISEWDPREAAHTKGGYLEGQIKVPDFNGQMKMVIQTYPAADADPLISNVHPILLHVVRIGKGKRDQELEPVPTYFHWKQVFEIKDGNVSILNRLSELDMEKDGQRRNVPLKDVVTRMEGNAITLGRKRGQLNLVLLQPKQKSRAQKAEATVTKVLMDRLKTNDEAVISKYERLYKGKNSKNLKRLRLKVDFYTDTFQYSVISPQTIVDSGNKDIGAMDFVDAHPQKSCTNGGRLIIIISEYNLSKDITPIFQIFTSDSINGEIHRHDLDQYLVQPEENESRIEIRNTQITFRSPAQPMLQRIREDFTLKLAVRRNGDGYISSTKFNFEYEPHVAGNCLECDWDVDMLKS